jgi:hypothetical protein
MDPDRSHICVVEVYDNRLRAWVDGKLLKDWPTRYTEFSVTTAEQLRPKDATRLAIGVWNSPTAFHKVEVLELSGAGRLLRVERPAR